MNTIDSNEIQIRDPIHGTLRLSRDEVALLDHPSYQRLRTIKQLGMADLAFPGATHSRYAHGLGAMHVASRMFASLAKHFDLPREDAFRLLATLRIAALFHDVGHPPLSHSTEAFMPEVKALDLGHWMLDPDGRRATHEDYTLAILTRSDLANVIERRFGHAGIEPDDVATLIAGTELDHRRHRFIVGGRNWMPVLRHCVSSELDADRMDYLLRDSYYAGVPYGRFDLEWLLENLVPVAESGAIHLGLNARASFGFEDYLLSRYHMFLSVYFHHIPIGYEVMLEKFRKEDTGELLIPADLDTYLECDDVSLLGALRRSKSPWARRIVERKAYRMLLEVRRLESTDRHTVESSTELGDPSSGVAPARDANFERARFELASAGIDSIAHRVKGALSKYFGTASKSGSSNLSLYVVEEGRAFPIEAYTPLYRRYAGAIQLERLYVDPARFADARAIVSRLGET